MEVESIGRRFHEPFWTAPVESMSRERILVVEDDEAILAGLREKLEMEGYRVLTAVDGEEARERLLRETEATFQERLTTLQAERDGAEEQITALKGELERARAVLDEERSRVIEDERFTVSDAGLVELERRSRVLKLLMG